MLSQKNRTVIKSRLAIVSTKMSPFEDGVVLTFLLQNIEDPKVSPLALVPLPLGLQPCTVVGFFQHFSSEKTIPRMPLFIQ